MARIIPPLYAEARFIQRMTGDPDPWICTLGIDCTSTPGGFQEVADDLKAAWTSRILIGQQNTLRLERVDLAVGQDGGEPVIFTSPGGAQGGLAGNVLPQNCAVLVQKRTDLGGRRNRGRMFVPAMLGENVVDNVGVITPAARTDFQTQFNNFYADIIAAGVDPVILHSEGLSTVPAPTPIDNFLVDGVIATQRRRLR